MNFRQFLSAVEIRTKIVSVSTYAISLGYIFLAGGKPDAVDALLLFASILMVDMGTTGFNSFFDYFKGVDSLALQREKDKVIVHEGVSPAEVLMVSLGLFATAAVIGIYFIVTTGIAVMLMGAASLLVGVLYSGGPKPISHTPLGELFAGGFLGTVEFVVVQYILTDDPAYWGHWVVLSLPLLLHIAAILTVNNTCDLDADRKAGRFTLSIALGRPLSKALIALLTAAGFGLNIVFALTSTGGLNPWSALIFTAGLTVSAIELRKMLSREMIQPQKGPSMGGISRILQIAVVSTLAAIGLSLVLAMFN